MIRTDYVLFVHPLCLSSLRVIKYLYEKKLLDRVRIVSTTIGSKASPFLDRIIYSVPMILRGNSLLGVDPLEEEYVEAIINSDKAVIEKYLPKDVESAINRFKDSIRSSSYVSLAVLYDPNIVDLLIDSEFFYGAIRRYYLGEERVKEYRSLIKERKQDFIDSIVDGATRNVTYNYLRESFLANQDKDDKQLYEEIVDRSRFLLWFQTKISMGRAYTFPELLFNPKKLDGVVDKVMDLLEKKFDKYLEHVRHEYKVFMDNADFLKGLGLI